MTDNMKIMLVGFTGNFDKCRYIREGKYGSMYLLPSHSKLKQSPLFVYQDRETQSVTIYRSIRKWYYNKWTLLDLTSSAFTKAMECLAKDLSIPMSELLRARISQCEIGQNVRVKIPPTQIIPKIVGYGNIKRSDNIKNETVYFFGTAKKLIIYDKLIEIGAKGGKRKGKAMQTMQDKGYHFLRIEFKLYDHNSFKSHQMGHIETVGDLIINFSNLYEFWTWQISNLFLAPSIRFDMRRMTKSEYAIATGIEYRGFECFLKEYLSLCKSKTAKGLKSARSRAKRDVYDVARKYASHEEYGFSSLKKDVARHLMLKSRQEEMDIPFLFRNLWGVNGHKHNNKRKK